MAITKRDLSTIRAVRDIATMENASFGMPHEYVQRCDSRGNPYANEGPFHMTDFIREQTRLWRESWIIGPLDDLIEHNTSA